MSRCDLIISSQGWPPPWPLLVEISHQTAREAWTLVGGLMVQIHTYLAGLAPIRVTTDVDLLLNLMVQGVSVARVAAELSSLGFTPQEPAWPDAPFHRLRRGDDVIDVLVPDHLPQHVRPRLLRRAVMPIEGGAQALERTMEVDLVSDGARSTVTIPDLLGALILKAAAAISDTRDPERHERDAAILAALITDHATQRLRLRGSDRRRLLGLAVRLTDPYNPAWLGLPEGMAVRGQDTLRILTA